MTAEFNRSLDFENRCKKLLLESKWEESYAEQEKQNEYERGLRELNERKNYLKTLFTTSKTIDVMHYRWRTNNSILIKHNKSKSEDINGNQVGEKSYASTIDNELNNGTRPYYSTIIENEEMISLQLPEPYAHPKLSIHTDGLQQALALSNDVNKNSSEQVLGKTLRGRTSSSVLEGGNAAPGKTNRNVDLNGSIVVTKHTSGIVNDVLKMLGDKPPPVAKGHISACDGHMLYKWDQDLMLKLAFSRLVCVSNLKETADIKLPLAPAIISIAKDLEIQNLLKYTVFSSWIKKSRWNMFELAAFVDSNSVANAKCISQDSWLEAARQASYENTISRKHIRTDSEHTEICVHDATIQKMNSKHSVKGYYAAKARSNLQVNENLNYKARILNIGDIVWGLHGRSVVWFPAVIEKINTEDDVTYDLRYLLSTKELRDKRNDAVNRQYMSLPSEHGSVVTSLLLCANERLLCERLFDIIDSEKSGLCSIENLLTVLAAPEIKRVVDSTVSLSMLIYGKAAPISNRKNKPIVPFASALHALFGAETAANGMINKKAFVEFCAYCGDINRFNQTY